MRKKQNTYGYHYFYWLSTLLLLQTIVCGVASAQQKKDGNLESQQSFSTRITLSDTSEINQAIKEANDIREKEFSSADILYLRALTASKKLGYGDGTVRALIGLGKCYSFNNQTEKAIHYTSEAIKYCGDNIKGHERLSTIYMLLSEVYYYKGRYDSCAYFRYAALGELENNKVLNNMMQLKVYCSILQFWLNVHDDIRSDPYIQQVVQRIDKIEQTALAAKDSNALVFIYFHKAGYYNNIRENDSARIYCNKHLALGKVLDVSPSMNVATLLNIGLTYLDDNQFDKAIEYIQKGISSIPSKNRTENRYYIFGNIFLGEVYVKQHNYQEAIAVTEPALATASKLKLLYLTDHAYKTLAESYEATGNYKKAYANQNQYAVIRDSMVKVQKLEIMYDMEMKYQISDKNKQLAEKELAIARNESRIKTKNFWIGGISAGLVLILLISLLLYRNHHHKEKLQAVRIRNLNQEVQITSLRSVITGEEKERSRIARELHDGMGGTLAAIRTQLSAIFRKHKTSDVNDDFIEVMDLLDEASADLRKTAHNLMPEILLQEGLAKATRLFCERVSKGHSLEIVYETWGKQRPLSGDIELTAYRIIQELVNNILKHAGATQALVQIVFHDSQLCITVEDNGRGLPENTEGKEGVGLKTIRERVKLLNGQIDIAGTTGKGTSVYIELTIATTKQNTAEI